MTIRLMMFLTLMIVGVIPAESQSSPFVGQACTLDQLPAIRLTCGTLTVPQNAADPASETLQLAVVIVHSQAMRPTSDPIVFLHGGPGSHTVNQLARLYESRYAPVLAAQRDLILFDQRGTGASHPALDCPQYTAFNHALLDRRFSGRTYEALEVRDLLLSALMDCVEGHASRHDLSAFHSSATAADVDALRQALGYEQINLWAISYGTRVALALLREKPHIVRSAVLDSVYPPDVDLFAEHPTNFDRALRTLFDACASDAACAERYPDLDHIFFATVATLERDPVMLDVYDPFSRTRKDNVVFDGGMMLDMTFRMLYRTQQLPQLPAIIDEAAQGRYDAYARMIASVAGSQRNISLGAYYAVQCAEELPFTPWSRLADSRTILNAYAPYLDVGFGREQFVQVCQASAVQARSAEANRAVYSTVPALLLTGVYDPVTPPVWAHRAVQTLPRGRVIELPATGHGSTGFVGCGQSLLIAFIQKPDHDVLDTGCTENLMLTFRISPAQPLDPVPLDSVFYPVAAH